MPRAKRPDMTVRDDYRTMRYIQHRLLEAGHPVTRRGSRGRELNLGPLRIEGSRTLAAPIVRRIFKDKLKPAEGQAFAVISAAMEDPDYLTGSVLMDVESLIQIIIWLIDADPDNFLREMKHRKGTDGK